MDKIKTKHRGPCLTNVKTLKMFPEELKGDEDVKREKKHTIRKRKKATALRYIPGGANIRVLHEY